MDSTPDATVVNHLLTLTPDSEREALRGLLMDKTTPVEQREWAVQQALTKVDWEEQREQVQRLLAELLPLERLVPQIYQEWRSVIRDAVPFVGARLTPDQLIPKLVEQIVLPAGTPLEVRLFKFIAKMPSLQKLGQIVARNPHLDPAFKAQLMMLENMLQDTTPQDVLAEIERQLRPRLKSYQVVTEEVILAEASVSAVVRFTWHNPDTGSHEEGVFKVLKPYVIENFPRELNILKALAEFADQNRKNYALPLINFRKIIDDVRQLLENEINFPNEQANLTLANASLADLSGVRVPRLIKQLSTPSITTLTAESGAKVTEAYQQSPSERINLATLVIEALIAKPMFNLNDEGLFHADPHAGNLLADETTGELVILDWALAIHLSRAQRRQIILLTFAIAWRDSHWIYRAVASLVQDDLDSEPAKADRVRSHIDQFLTHLSPFTVPGFEQIKVLLDGIVRLGVNFPAELLLFRKILFTLTGVLNDITGHVTMDTVLFRHILKVFLTEAPSRLLYHPLDSSRDFRTHLSNYDLTMFWWSLPLLSNRLLFQTTEQVRDQIFNHLGQNDPEPDETTLEQPAPDGKVDLNTANLSALAHLYGIGPVIGQRIIDYRARHGSFAAIDDLVKVKGIGPATLEKIKANITVGPPTTL